MVVEVTTVGHSTHEPERFVELLRGAKVEAIADVRRFPGSRRLPWFAAEEMQRWLPEAGIAYAHLPELGGRRKPVPGSPNGGWEVRQFQGYADHMGSSEFQAGLDRLLSLARDRSVAAMCAEGLWWRCHRRLLDDVLLVRGHGVAHLAPDGRAHPHELTPFAAVSGERVTYPPSQEQLPVG
jgi:uncharacterized protein (DUF488 family)